MTDRKITPEAAQRCAAHTLQDQLIAHLNELLAARRADLAADQSDITTAFAADRTPVNHKGWEDTSIEP